MTTRDYIAQYCVILQKITTVRHHDHLNYFFQFIFHSRQDKMLGSSKTFQTRQFKIDVKRLDNRILEEIKSKGYSCLSTDTELYSINSKQYN